MSPEEEMQQLIEAWRERAERERDEQVKEQLAREQKEREEREARENAGGAGDRETTDDGKPKLRVVKGGRKPGEKPVKQAKGNREYMTQTVAMQLAGKDEVTLGCFICPLDPPKGDFRKLVGESGGYRIIEVDQNGVCKIVGEEAIWAAISNRRYEVRAGKDFRPEFHKVWIDWPASMVRETATLFLTIAPEVKEEDILPFKEPLSEEEEEVEGARMKYRAQLAWHVLPWKLDGGSGEGYPTPYFDEMMSRVAGGEELMQWIGSLFDFDGDRSQYLFLNGPGGVGKSQLADFLIRVLGCTAASLEAPRKEDRWFTSELIGKRLGVFSDCNEVGFIQSSKFKAITGSSYIRCETKFEAPITVRSHCKMMLLTNMQFNFGEDAAMQRRIVLCEMKAREEGSEPMSPLRYQEYLWREGRAWLGKCKSMYFQMKNERGTFIRSKAMQERIKRVITENEDDLAETMDRWFDRVQYDESLPKYLRDGVTREEMKFIRNTEKMSPYIWRKFVEFMGKRGVTREEISTRVGKQVVVHTRWLGIVLSPEAKEEYGSKLQGGRERKFLNSMRRGIPNTPPNNEEKKSENFDEIPY